MRAALEERRDWLGARHAQQARKSQTWQWSAEAACHTAGASSPSRDPSLRFNPEQAAAYRRMFEQFTGRGAFADAETIPLLEVGRQLTEEGVPARVARPGIMG